MHANYVGMRIDNGHGKLTKEGKEMDNDIDIIGDSIAIVILFFYLAIISTLVLTGVLKDDNAENSVRQEKVYCKNCKQDIEKMNKK